MSWVTIKDILQIFREDFDHQTTLGKDNRLTTGLDGQPRQPRGLRTCGRTHAELSIDHRRIPQQQVFFPCGAPLSVIAVTSAPMSCLASSTGLAMVAEHKINRGVAP